MLVVSRKVGERIVISDNIIVTVLESNPGRIRIGIDAPKDVPVHREEVYERLQAECPNGRVRVGK